MKEHRNEARKRLARCLDAIDEEYIEILAPLIVKVIAVVQRFFAAPNHTEVDIPIRNRTREGALEIRTKHPAGGLQSPGT